MLHAVTPLPSNNRNHLCIRTLTALILLLCCAYGARSQNARTDTSKTTTVNILHSDNYFGLTTDSGNYSRLVGNVQMEQNGTLMNCDSAYLSQEKNNFEGYGNVHIIQPNGTQIQSDYIRYTGNTKLAYLRGNASLTDGKNNLWCEELTYDLNTKIAVYTNGGTLQTETTTLSSNAGTYNTNTKDARFTGEVYVTDPKYNVVSDDLGYNTDTKLVRFFAPSVVTNETSVLHTKSGTYDSKLERAHFTERSSMQNESQYLEGDKIDYDRASGYGHALGNVIAIDTAQHMTLWSGYAAYNEKRKTLLATIKPVMRRENGRDSIFIRSDTMYSGPDLGEGYKRLYPVASVATPPESRKEKRRKKKEKEQVGQDSLAVVPADTVFSNDLLPVGAPEQPIDSTTPRFFIGYGHVLIFSDSLQGRCDSISYTQKDSIMRMMKDPVTWSRKGQISGDTILLYNDSGQIKKMFVPNNALVVSQSGPDKAQLYDQVQGKTLTGYFRNNALDYVVVWPNAESIYFAKDDSGAYVGVNQAQSERMKIYFQEQEIDHIIFEQEVKQTMTPLDQADLPSLRLSRFRWREKERPKKLEELFD